MRTVRDQKVEMNEKSAKEEERAEMEVEEESQKVEEEEEEQAPMDVIESEMTEEREIRRGEPQVQFKSEVAGEDNEITCDGGKESRENERDSEDDDVHESARKFTNKRRRSVGSEDGKTRKKARKTSNELHDIIAMNKIVHYPGEKAGMATQKGSAAGLRSALFDTMIFIILTSCRSKGEYLDARRCRLAVPSSWSATGCQTEKNNHDEKAAYA